jgi:hypothetical protein
MADPTVDLARLVRLEVGPAEDLDELAADLSHVRALCDVHAVFGSEQDALRGQLAAASLGSLSTSRQIVDSEPGS